MQDITTKDDVLADYKEVNAEIDPVPTPSDIYKHGDVRLRDYYIRFGSWESLLENFQELEYEDIEPLQKRRSYEDIYESQIIRTIGTVTVAGERPTARKVGAEFNISGSALTGTKWKYMLNSASEYLKAEVYNLRNKEVVINE